MPDTDEGKRIMLSEKDKINLFGGKKYFCKYFAKRKALKELDLLIAEANEILATYPSVQFGNEFETAQMYTNLLAKETQWSSRGTTVLWKIFGNQTSDLEQIFRCAIVHNSLHAYAGIRSTLEKKKDILDEFRDDIRVL